MTVDSKVHNDFELRSCEGRLKLTDGFQSVIVREESGLKQDRKGKYKNSKVCSYELGHENNTGHINN